MADLQFDCDWEGLDEAFQALEAEVTEVVRGIAIETWNRVLLQTPQYYGRAVASWSFSIGSPMFVDRSSLVAIPEAVGEDMWGVKEYGPGSVKSKGNLEAINIANAYASLAPWTFRLGDDVFISNGSDHAGLLEKPEIMLRAVNRPGQMVARTLNYIENRYGDNVTPQSAARLKEKKIGG